MNEKLMPGTISPWTCGNCAQKKVTPIVQDYSTQFKHDGKLHDLVVRELPVPTCESCGTQQFGVEQSDKVTNALREKVGLLFPDEIKRRRTELNLSQEQLGECIGAAKESISRWETGALIQSVSTDKLLRMFFKHPTDPIWRNRWTAVDEASHEAGPSAARKAWGAALDQSYVGIFAPADYFHEIRNSIERRLLSQLMVDDSKLPYVGLHLCEADFQDIVLRRTYAAMKSVFHDSGKIIPRRLADSLASRIGEFPIDASAVIIFLMDTAMPSVDIEELVTVLSRRSQVRRQLNESV